MGPVRSPQPSSLLLLAPTVRHLKPALIIRNLPGDGFAGLSLATSSNLPVKVRLPRDTVCQGKVAGLDNVCFVRLRNNAFAGPFGGAAFFTQSEEARKRHQLMARDVQFSSGTGYYIHSIAKIHTSTMRLTVFFFCCAAFGMRRRLTYSGVLL